MLLLRQTFCFPSHYVSSLGKITRCGSLLQRTTAFKPAVVPQSVRSNLSSSRSYTTPCAIAVKRQCQPTPYTIATRTTPSLFVNSRITPHLGRWFSKTASTHKPYRLDDTKQLPSRVDYQLQSIHFQKTTTRREQQPSRARTQFAASTEDDSDGVIASGSRLVWEQRPRTALLVKKPADQATERALVDVAQWLRQQNPPFNVIIERKVAAALSEQLPFAHVVEEDDYQEYERVVDFVVTIGGDGTILHVSSIFNKRVPPIVSFSMGTLGFLLPFHFKDYMSALSNLMNGHASLLPRLRLECTAFTSTGEKIKQAGNKQRLAYMKKLAHAIDCDNDDRSVQVMNEVNLHRGRYPHLSAVSCYINGEFLTDAVADGLIIATPTGSTAYSLSAGGPIVHPSVASLLITPVCPLSLSFRPVLLPADSNVQIQVSTFNRGQAELTVDGRVLCLLPVGSYVQIKQSSFPMLCVNRVNEGVDWVRDINQMLKFNQGFANKHQLLMRTDADWE
ncbi:ATP-NAD kinase-like domain-containing protein [Syncephalis fuscata]|nr:ATP-NAD kinase-like domain-containing protein [Syncephalis fuscata]